MAPQSTSIVEPIVPQKKEEKEFKQQIMWQNVVFLIIIHLIFFYALYIGLTVALWQTWAFMFLTLPLPGLGICAGAHRLWCHRSYKAKLPLRIILAVLHSSAAQTDLYDWCRDHRVHHKFTETTADPHDIRRGFFFAHVGWLMCRKHPDVASKGKTVSLDDLLADPVVKFERKYHIPMVILFALYLPTMIPYWCWGEPIFNAFVGVVGRYVLILNATWLVNSAAHMFGDKPFDKSIEASENPFVAFFAMGEGWHNYHHAFPWDYSTSELGYNNNGAKYFIDTMARIGWAYDLKTAPLDLVHKTKLKSGDGTRLDEVEHPKTS